MERPTNDETPTRRRTYRCGESTERVHVGSTSERPRSAEGRIRATSRLADHQHGRAIPSVVLGLRTVRGSSPVSGGLSRRYVVPPPAHPRRRPDREEWIDLLRDLPYSLP